MIREEERHLTREMRLRNCILNRYGSLRRFALDADIPYSSVLTILSRGIGGASFDTVMKICRTLEMDAEEIYRL